MARSFVLILVWLSAILVLIGCANRPQIGEADLSSRPIRVVTTVGMVTDMVEIVGGERVDVVGLMGSGVDPHLYKASEGDVIRLGEADLIFFVGLHLEAGMGKVLERIAERRGNAVSVTRNIDPEMYLSPPEFEGAYDPHIWFDVALWAETVKAVSETLSGLDPGSAEYYQQNAIGYLAQLDVLDDYVQRQAERIPERNRVLITAHDAFNYFGHAYGFEVRGLQGISTATEASSADVSRLVDFIVERQISAIFIESSVPQRNVEAVQAAARARGWDLAIGGELFSDAMGDAGTEEGTYIGMVKHNIDTIVDALLAGGR